MWDDLWINLTLQLRSLTWLDWLDLAMVTAVLYLLVSVAQRTRATFILRGATISSLILLVFSLLLPLPTFGLLIRGILVFLLVALPVVFQRELRRLLEEVGRSIGLTRGNLQQTTEALVEPLVEAVAKMARSHTGALIVLEGKLALDEIAQTGVPIEGYASGELIGAIFYPSNPLHDGAVLIRGKKLLAASCVLPLSRQDVQGHRRLGTRHRAAVGLSERADALVIVVSEETGRVSVAHSGLLETVPDLEALREQMTQFSRQANKASASSEDRSLFGSFSNGFSWTLSKRTRHILTRLALSVVFAITLWWFVLSTSRSLPRVDIQGVPLQLQGLPPGMAIANQLPRSVDLQVRTVEGVVPQLNEQAFTALVSLEGVSDGLHQLPVQIMPRIDAPVSVMTVDPALVDVNMTVIASRTLSITVLLEDESLLPLAYEVQEEPVIDPPAALVSGPQPLVEQVAEVRATLSLSRTTSSVTVIRSLLAVDEEGSEISGVSLEPAQAEIALLVGRRDNVREAGVAVVTTGEPGQAYWVSGLIVQPSTVVLNGPPGVLAEIGNLVNTLPVDISGAVGDLTVDIPLDLPEDVVVMTPDGRSMRAVRVMVHISPRRTNQSFWPATDGRIKA